MSDEKQPEKPDANEPCMAGPSPEERRALKRFEVALATRQLEIELFWRRSLFFWGFIAAAFGALAWVYGKHPRLAVAISSFGLVCSSAWTLTNRGSRFWQVSWETQVNEAEDDVVGPMFKNPSIEKPSDLCWKGRRYSVSRLAISLSDYVVLLWSLLLACQLVLLAFPKAFERLGDCLTIGFALFSVAFVLFVRRETSRHDDT